MTAGDTIKKRSYQATFITTPPVIDGTLDDEAWELGTWQGDFTQFEPHNGAPPSQKSEFKILFDDNNIYVAIKAWDHNADSIVVRIARRDQGDGDFVGVGFDSYHDLLTGFGFGTTAAGVKNDFKWSLDGQVEDDSWDPDWYTAARVYDWGWATEMRIPLTQLRFKINDEGLWGLQVFRRLYRSQEMSFWQHIDRNASGLIHNFGRLTGMTGIRPKKQADITPFLLGSLETFEKEDGNPFLTGRAWRYNGGLDAKFGVTNNMTLDFSFNPDFGQVEADPSEVNLTAYETYFSEKRPFFIEGNNITSLKVGVGDGEIGNENIFYSRRIGRNPHLTANGGENEYVKTPRVTPIISAAKLTGRTSEGLSLAILEVVAAETNAIVESSGERRKETVEPLTNYFVSRISKDWGDGRRVMGGAFTNTYRFLDGRPLEELVRSANTAGLDYTQYLGEKREWFIMGAATASSLSGSKSSIEKLQLSSVHFYQRPDADYLRVDPDRTRLNGFGGNIQAGKMGGKWNFMGFTYLKSPGLDLNDVGYLMNADQIVAGLWSAYHFNKPFGIFREIRPNANLSALWDWGGTHLSSNANLSIYARFKNLWWAQLGTSYSGESLSTTHLRGGPAMKMPAGTNWWFSAGTNNAKSFYGSVWINGSHGAEKSSELLSAGVSFNIQPGKSFTASLSPSWSQRRNNLQYVTQVSTPDRYILGELNQQIVSLSFRMNYNITPDLTVEYWGQPFLAAMKYGRFSKVTSPGATDLNDRYHIFTDAEITLDEAAGRYLVDENNVGTTLYTFNRPDYNFDQFLSNLVVRWEFRPGSTIYLVWSQTRDHFDPAGTFSLNQNLKSLYSDNKPYDVFLIKFTYRFGLR